MYETLIKLIQEEINNRLDKKTSFGRNELRVELDAALIAAQARLLNSVPCLKGGKSA